MGCGGGGGSQKVEDTADQKAFAKVGVEQWNEYAVELAPKIQKWAKGVAADKTVDKQRMTGVVNADIAQGAAGAERVMTAGGMNPNSGRSVATLADAGNKIGTINSGAGVSAVQGVDNNRIARLQQVVDIGMGQKSEAIDGMGAIAEQSVRGAISDAGRKQLTHQADVSLGMGVAGVAAGAGMDYFNNKKAADSANNYMMTHNNTTNGPLWRP